MLEVKVESVQLEILMGNFEENFSSPSTSQFLQKMFPAIILRIVTVILSLIFGRIFKFWSNLKIFGKFQNSISKHFRIFFKETIIVNDYQTLENNSIGQLEFFV